MLDQGSNLRSYPSQLRFSRCAHQMNEGRFWLKNNGTTISSEFNRLTLATLLLVLWRQTAKLDPFEISFHVIKVIKNIK